MRTEQTERKFFKKSDGILLLVLLAIVLAIFGYLIWKSNERSSLGKSIAVISSDGEEILRVPLEETPDGTVIDLKSINGKPVQFEIDDAMIRFINVQCPDHICEKAGYLKKPSDTAVCMPNRTAVVIYDSGELQPEQ